MNYIENSLLGLTKKKFCLFSNKQNKKKRNYHRHHKEIQRIILEYYELSYFFIVVQVEFYFITQLCLGNQFYTE